MSEWKYPLWSVFAATTLVSPLFLLLKNPGYTIEGLLYWNIIFWFICGLVYAGEFVYKKYKEKNGKHNR